MQINPIKPEKKFKNHEEIIVHFISQMNLHALDRNSSFIDPTFPEKTDPNDFC